jgi:hypothetical protein
MSSFPPADWEVRYLQDMETYTAEPNNCKLTLAALLAVKQAGPMEGSFRFVLAGTEDLVVKLPVTSFIPSQSHGGVSLDWPVPARGSDHRAAQCGGFYMGRFS